MPLAMLDPLSVPSSSGPVTLIIIMFFGKLLQCHFYSTLCSSLWYCHAVSGLSTNPSRHYGNIEPASTRHSTSPINQSPTAFSNPFALFSLSMIIYLSIISNGTTFVSRASTCPSTGSLNRIISGILKEIYDTFTPETFTFYTIKVPSQVTGSLKSY